MKQIQTDIIEQAVRGAPAAAGAVATAVTLSEWVGVVTIVYVIIQAVYLFWKALWERQEKIEARERAVRREAREERAVVAAELREESRKRLEDRYTHAAPMAAVEQEAT